MFESKDADIKCVCELSAKSRGFADYPNLTFFHFASAEQEDINMSGRGCSIRGKNSE
jgi:hypothetical protein